MRLQELDEAWKLPGWLGGASKAERGAEAGTDAERAAAHAGGDLSTLDRWKRRLGIGSKEDDLATTAARNAETDVHPELTPHFETPPPSRPTTSSPASTEVRNVSPRPRKPSKAKAWDEKYGDTHQPNGKPKQPEPESSAPPVEAPAPATAPHADSDFDAWLRNNPSEYDGPSFFNEPNWRTPSAPHVETPPPASAPHVETPPPASAPHVETPPPASAPHVETPPPQPSAAVDNATTDAAATARANGEIPKKPWYQTKRQYFDSLTADERAALLKREADWRVYNPEPVRGETPPSSALSTAGKVLGTTALGATAAGGGYVAGHIKGQADEIRAQREKEAAGGDNDGGNKTSSVIAAPLPPGVSADDTKNESLSMLLKLSGQRAITERDNTSGLTKPRKIEMLKESASINISADSGSEITSMLGDIMRLAGVKDVTPEMFPQAEVLPMVKALHVMGGEIPSAEHDHGHGHEEQLTGDVCPSCGQEDCGCEEMEETYDNTPDPKIQKYDPNNMAHVINKVKTGELEKTPYGSGSNPMPVKEASEEQAADPVKQSLWQAYEAFKNS